MTGRLLVAGVTAAIGVFGIVVLALDSYKKVGTFASPAAFGAVLMVAVGLLGWWILSRIRPISSAPAARGLACLAWGMTGAAGCAMLANTGQGAFLSRAMDIEVASSWGAALSAPINEEILKMAGLVLLSLAFAGMVRGPMEGFIYGSLVGLGFQILEDWTYAVNGILDSGAIDPIASVQDTFITRVVATGLGSHWAMSAIAGAGIGYLLTHRGSGRRVVAGVALFLLAMLLHGFFDAPVLAELDILKGLLTFVIAIALYGALRHRLRAVARAELDGERRSALLTRHGRRQELREHSPDGDRTAAAQSQRERLDQLEERAYAAT